MFIHFVSFFSRCVDEIAAMRNWIKPNYYIVAGEAKPINRSNTMFMWLLRRKFCLLVIVVLIVLGYLFLRRPQRSVVYAPDNRVELKMEPGAIKKHGLSIEYAKKIFLLDGKPFRIFSGSIHYFRVPRAYWKDRMLKLKASGLNTVDTYVAWNMHEERRGQFDFSGNLDLAEFLTVARDVGLYAILRPGPYICAEWDWGGLPPWLLSDPNMKVRTTYKGYMEPVDAFLKEVFRRVGALQRSKTGDGPLIAVQIENEYGSYGNDKLYMQQMKKILRDAGVIEFLFTSDGPDKLMRGFVPGVYSTVNFNDKTDEGLTALKEFQPNLPLMSGEFWPGWFDHWAKRHHVMAPEDMVTRLKPLLEREASFNLYMFHGGTNFGFMNGANIYVDGDKKKADNGVLARMFKTVNEYFFSSGQFNQSASSSSSSVIHYAATVTSYDYDAPVSEHGGKTAKFDHLKQLLLPYLNEDQKRDVTSMDPWKDWRPPFAYGDVKVQSVLSLTDALEHLKPVPLDLRRPTFVERLKAKDVEQLYYGFIVYRTSIGKDTKTIKLNGTLADRMVLVLDGKTLDTIESKNAYEPFSKEFDIPTDGTHQGSRDLILLVENTGRVNYAHFPHLLDNMYKGFEGTVTGNGQEISNEWTVYSIRFKSPADLQTLVGAAQWKSVVDAGAMKGPTFHKMHFDVPDGNKDFPDDTFLNMKGWTKGVVYSNGINLGRYWNAGPPKTLYVPGPWLKKGSNELVIFELHDPATTVTFQADPELGEPCLMPCKA